MLSAPRIAGLALALPLALVGAGAGSASAASVDGLGAASLSVTTSGGTATLTGTAATASYLWAYAQPAGTPCGATVHDEQGTTGAWNFISALAVPAGPFTETRTVLALSQTGTNKVCGYLSSPPTDPSAPGPVYKIPDASASSQPTVSNACTPRAFSVVKMEIAPQAVYGNYYGHGTLTAHADGPGTLTLSIPGPQTDYSPHSETVPAGGGDVSWPADAVGVATSDYGKDKPVVFQVAFVPASGSTCVQPDGTLVTDWVAAPRSFNVTYTFGGGGSSDLGPASTPAATTAVAPRINVLPSVISAGQRATVYYASGTPGSTLQILSKTQPATTYSVIDTVTLDSSGNGSSSHAPHKNTRIMVRTPEGLTSAQPLISVRSVASLNVRRVATRQFTFAGTVSPAVSNRLVNLYRNGALVAQGRTNASGVYSITKLLSAGSYVFQAKTGNDVYNLGATSPARSANIY